MKKESMALLCEEIYDAYTTALGLAMRACAQDNEKE